ncbi:MAG: TraM recognition domain-containing protein [Planctomycetaceae bacterium]|nr:TraM recognition domain-containing protein [Planctomycetaceae bacterium]
MPRDVYDQNHGNPVQPDLLPSQPLSLQFARRNTDPSASRALLRSVMRNLCLVAGICLAGDWLGHAFSLNFPANLIIVIVMANGLVRLWQAVNSYRPHLLLLGIPFAVHFLSPSMLVRAMITATLAAYVGREFTRHFVQLATSFPMPPQEATAQRQLWEGLSLASALLVIPCILPIAVPQHAAFGLMLLLSAVVVILAVSNPLAIWLTAMRAWLSWLTYNPQDESAAGVVSSPAGPLPLRVGMTVLLVADMTLLLSSILPVSEVIWGNHTFGFVEAVITVPFAFFMIALPVGLVAMLMLIVAAPALCRFSSTRPPEADASWSQVTEALQNSDNEIERDSLFCGRLAHDGSPLLVPRAVFKEHAHILGDSGSGKNARGLLPLAEQLVADQQSSLMVIDLKGDSQEFLSSLQHCADRYGNDGSPIPVRQFTVREDHATFAFNPFQLPCWQRLNLFQQTDVLCGALGLIYGTDYGRGYYSSANASVLHATLKAYPDVGSFAELSDRINFVTARSKGHGQSDKQGDAGTHVKMICERLASFKALNVTPDHAPAKEVSASAMDPTQLFARQEIFYFHLSTTLGPGSSPEIARLAMFMLLTTATLTDQRRQVYLMIDEFQRVAAHNVDAILQIARSMNVGVILVNQSMADLKRDDLVSVVETNCCYRQWFAISSPDEQHRLSRGSGETIDVLHSETTSRQRDGFDVRVTNSMGAKQIVAPRLTINDVKLASDDPRKSIALVTRGAGYSQFGGMPVVVESDFHISESEFLSRKHAPWPAATPGSFIPEQWSLQRPTRGKKSRKRGPQVTEELIGDEPGLFDRFLSDTQEDQP